jgi:hypothetical protein
MGGWPSGAVGEALASPPSPPYLARIMRADAETLHEQITASVALLRRHL